MRREDLPQVVGLYEQVMRSGSRTAPPDLCAYFERTLLDHPWADPDIPSLVYEDGDGKIIGFIGSHVRRMRFGGRQVRLACAGQLVADPGARRRAPGTFLLRKYLSGPQDVTITDGGNATVLQIWGRLGGQTTGLRCLEWTRVFRPWRFLGDIAARRLRLDGLNLLLRPLWRLLDAVTALLARSRVRVAPPAVRAERLTAETLVEELPRLAGDARLYPDYDRAFVDWLFAELEGVTNRGRLVRNVVRDEDGRTLGWYVYYLLRGGISEVIQVMAGERDADLVLDHLFHHAQSNGASALQGRAEPRLLEPLHDRRCFFRYGEWALAHSSDPEMLVVATSQQALLSRMEGEWWMGHHLLGLGPGASYRPPPESVS